MLLCFLSTYVLRCTTNGWSSGLFHLDFPTSFQSGSSTRIGFPFGLCSSRMIEEIQILQTAANLGMSRVNNTNSIKTRPMY